MREMGPGAFGVDHHHMARDALILRIASTDMDTAGVVYGVAQVPAGVVAPTALIECMLIKVRDYGN
jgi:hypothetical protein